MGVPARSEQPLEEKEYPDAADLDEDDPATDVVRCPGCGEWIYEDAPQCPYCREWILGSSAGWRESRKWYVRGGLYLAKTLLVNWFFWLAVAALAAVVTVVELLR